MQNAIILHGKPSKENYYDPHQPAQSNKHWTPWLQQQLIVNDILTQTPEMPRPYEPVYEEWERVFEQFHVGATTHLIGHSCGGGFLVRWLSERPVEVGKVVLVAPWIDPEGELATNFFDFTINSDLAKRTKGVWIFVDWQDRPKNTKSVKKLRKELPESHLIEVVNYGHFLYSDMGTVEFPQLRDVLVEY